MSPMRKEARRDCNHGRATHRGKQIVTRDRIDVAVAIIVGAAIMFGALLTEVI